MVRASDEAEGKVSGEPWVTVGVLPHFGPVGSASSLSDGAPSVGDNRVSPHLDRRLMLCKETSSAPLRPVGWPERPSSLTKVSKAVRRGLCTTTAFCPTWRRVTLVDSQRFAPLRRRS